MMDDLLARLADTHVLLRSTLALEKPDAHALPLL